MIEVEVKGRPCKGEYDVLVNGVYQRRTFDLGYFHQWGMQSTEFETGGVTDSVAIVELESGAVVTVMPNKLMFL